MMDKLVFPQTLGALLFCLLKYKTTHTLPPEFESISLLIILDFSLKIDGKKGISII